MQTLKREICLEMKCPNGQAVLVDAANGMHQFSH